MGKWLKLSETQFDFRYFILKYSWFNNTHEQKEVGSQLFLMHFVDNISLLNKQFIVK